MNTKTTYPVKGILVAGLILIQVHLLANGSSEFTKVPVAAKIENSYSNISEEAFEAEYEIEDWMHNIQNDVWNSDAIEEEQELEEWMYNTKHYFWLDLSDAEDIEPAIENWMTNPNDWIYNGNELILSSK